MVDATPDDAMQPTATRGLRPPVPAADGSRWLDLVLGPRREEESYRRRVSMARRQAVLAKVRDDLSRFLRLAESEEILITRHGKPAEPCPGLVDIPDRTKVR